VGELRRSAAVFRASPGTPELRSNAGRLFREPRSTSDTRLNGDKGDPRVRFHLPWPTESDQLALLSTFGGLSCWCGELVLWRSCCL